MVITYHTTDLYDNGSPRQKQWFECSGKLHRDRYPAFIVYYNNGKIKHKRWFQHGRCHRLDGPAFIEYEITGDLLCERWCIGGKYHRLDGPAWIRYYPGYNQIEYWFINGNDITDEIVPWIKTNNIDLNNPSDMMRLKLVWG